MVRFVFYIACSVLILSCRSQRSIEIASFKEQDSTMIYLKEGQNLFLEGEQLNITFERVVEDSRCPEGLNCVWSGVAAIDLTLMGTYTRPQKVTLASTVVAEKDYKPFDIFNGYIIRLNDLAPYPSSAKAKKSTEKYSAKISIVKRK